MPQPQSAVLDHEKLTVYHRSLDLSSIVAVVSDAWPIGKHTLLDQLLRASASVTLNIAEGAGEFSPREKARFYRMARRSATECSAVMDVSIRHKAVTPDDRTAARAIILELVAMLTRLICRLGPESARETMPKPTRLPPAAKTDAIGTPVIRRPVHPDRPFFPEPFGDQSA